LKNNNFVPVKFPKVAWRKEIISKTFFGGFFLPFWGTVEFSSEIAISLNFTAEHTENAEAPESPNNNRTVLKLCVLCALRGDKSLYF